MYKDLEANAAAVTRIDWSVSSSRARAVDRWRFGLPDDVRRSTRRRVSARATAQVVDADASQLRAIAAAARGYDLVIEGPPGTGKSQTITNLDRAGAAAGKSVLFVAEKMAALDVVHQRLQRAGLGEFCLELHSTKFEQARRDQEHRRRARRVAAAGRRAGRRRGGCRRCARRSATTSTAVHEPFGAIATSPFSAYGELAPVLEAPRVDWTGDPAQVTRAALSRSRAPAVAAAAAPSRRRIAPHPWRDTTRTFYPQDQIDAVVAAAERRGASASPRPASTPRGQARARPPAARRRLADLGRLRGDRGLLGGRPERRVR